MVDFRQPLMKEINKSSHRICSVRKGVLRNFAKFTGKHLCHSLFFNKVASKVCNFIEKRLWHRCFPVTFTKFLRTPFLTEHLFYRPRPGDCFWIKVFKGLDFERFRSQTLLYGNQNYHSSINRLIIISTIEYKISNERFKYSLFD